MSAYPNLKPMADRSPSELGGKREVEPANWSSSRSVKARGCASRLSGIQVKMSVEADPRANDSQQLGQGDGSGNDGCKECWQACRRMRTRLRDSQLTVFKARNQSWKEVVKTLVPMRHEVSRPILWLLAGRAVAANKETPRVVGSGDTIVFLATASRRSVFTHSISRTTSTRAIPTCGSASTMRE